MVRAHLPRGGLAAIVTAVLVAAAGPFAPSPASAATPAAAAKYQVCWWQVDQPNASFDCAHGSFTGATAVVNVPSGNCWSNNQQGGTVQVNLNGQWVDIPGVAVQYETGLYCTDASAPYMSFARLPVKTKRFGTMQLRFLVPFNGTTDIAPTTVLCVRWTKNKKFCQD
jgi:uncharacterized membrane protein